MDNGKRKSTSILFHPARIPWHYPLLISFSSSSMRFSSSPLWFPAGYLPIMFNSLASSLLRIPVARHWESYGNNQNTFLEQKSLPRCVQLDVYQQGRWVGYFTSSNGYLILHSPRMENTSFVHSSCTNECWTNQKNHISCRSYTYCKALNEKLHRHWHGTLEFVRHYH